MPTVTFESLIDAPVEKVWEFHNQPDALNRLSPPGRKVGLISKNNKLENGALHVLRVTHFGMPLIWEARISDVNPPNGFTDTAEMAPFRVWVHKHEFIAQGDKTLLRDTLTYEHILGPLGRLMRMIYVDRAIKKLFAYRHKRTQEEVVKLSGTSNSPEHQLVETNH